MTSNDSKALGPNEEAFIWIWLPDEAAPVVAGRLTKDNDGIRFNYGKSYLERVDAGLPCLSIYEPELPLQSGLLPLPSGLTMPGSIKDVAPDAWGRRVMINKMLGLKGTNTDTAETVGFA